MNINFENHSIKKLGITDKIQSFFPGSHKFLDKLPEPWRSKAIVLGYKLGFIKQMGYFKMEELDKFGKKTGKKSFGANIVTNSGVTQIRNYLTLANTNAIKNLGFGNPVTPTAPAVGDTVLNTPLSGTTRLVGTVTSPGSYELRVEALLGTTYGPTRNYIITEIGLFADPLGGAAGAGGGVLIARAIVSPSFTMTTAPNSATATYGLLFR